MGNMEIIDLATGDLSPYIDTWKLQKNILEKITQKDSPNTLILVEHESVYTAGSRTNAKDIQEAHGVDVIKVDRGGRITWHGPGQITCYPLFLLRTPVDPVRHIRLLEQSVMHVCKKFSLNPQTVAGRSGVWVKSKYDNELRKICAVGCRVTRNVTMHGIGINICPDLSYFQAISPCGITDAEVTSISQELNRTVSITEVKPLITAAVENFTRVERDLSNEHPLRLEE